jgi:hypothetical protein
MCPVSAIHERGLIIYSGIRVGGEKRIQFDCMRIYLLPFIAKGSMRNNEVVKQFTAIPDLLS